MMSRDDQAEYDAGCSPASASHRRSPASRSHRRSPVRTAEYAVTWRRDRWAVAKTRLFQMRLPALRFAARLEHAEITGFGPIVEITVRVRRVGPWEPLETVLDDVEGVW